VGVPQKLLAGTCQIFGLANRKKFSMMTFNCRSPSYLFYAVLFARMRKVTPPSNLETVVEELVAARPLNAKSEPIFYRSLVFSSFSRFLSFSRSFIVLILIALLMLNPKTLMSPISDSVVEKQ
jgi:hypothetical protein